MKTLLTVDFNSVLYTQCGAFRALINSEGKFTGGIYGFVQAICKAINTHNPDEIVFCSDYRPYIRNKYYPDYKIRTEGNPETDSQRESSRQYCHRFLKLLNLTLWKIKGYEADDLIAYICKTKRFLDYSIIIQSKDDDLYQLLSERVSIWKDTKRGSYTIENFINENPDLTPNDWPLLKAIEGSHNGIKGIKGYGPKKAKDILNSEGFCEFYKQYKDEIDLYHELIHLPMKGINSMPEITKGIYDEGKLLDFLDEFNIRMTFPMTNALQLIGSN